MEEEEKDVKPGIDPEPQYKFEDIPTDVEHEIIVEMENGDPVSDQTENQWIHGTKPYYAIKAVPVPQEKRYFRCSANIFIEDYGACSHTFSTNEAMMVHFRKDHRGWVDTFFKFQ